MKDLTEKYQENHFKDSDLFTLHDITHVNHKPHPFVIGTKHVKHASDNYGGMLGEDTMNAIPCAHKGCNLSYAEHTADRIILVQLKRNAANKEVSDFFKSLLTEMTEDKIDGVSFIETEEKFRVDE